MLDLIKKQDSEIIDKQGALELFDEVRTYATLAVANYVRFCSKIKEIRDKKAYKAAGYETFEECTKAEFNFGQRQAYSYIAVIENLGADYININAGLGISKLSILASATAEERKQLENSEIDISAVSTKELTEALNEIKNLKQQISFLEEEASGMMTEAQVKDRIAKAEEQARVDALQGYAKNMEDARRAQKQAEEQAKAVEFEMNSKIAEVISKEAQKVKEIEERAKVLEQELEIEKNQSKIDPETQNMLAKLQEEKDKLEKQLKVSSDPVMTKFKFMLSGLQDEFNQILAYTHSQDAEDGKQKMLGALKKVVQHLLEKVAAEV